MSLGEEAFALQCKAVGLKPVREFFFHPVRLWRFDFAFVAERLAVEVEGGIWTGGRHTQGAAFSEDCVKYAHAAILGWRVIRATTDQVVSGQALGWVEQAIAGALDVPVLEEAILDT